MRTELSWDLSPRFAALRSSPTPKPLLKPPSPPRTANQIGVDTGGTFTDLVWTNGAETHVVKVPSSPHDPGEAIATGVRALGADRAHQARIIHGTTVGLNALLTRNLGRAALVTNAGFRDLIEIGRQARPDIYALHPVQTEPLIPRKLRFEVAQRSWPDPDTGALVEVERPTDADLDALATKLQKARVESVAIALLHSWSDAAAEERIAAVLRAKLPDVAITTSAGLSPTLREHERFTTATINAALAPVVSRYIARLETSLKSLGARELVLLQSSGGTLSAVRAAAEPARILLSGPAGGVRGAIAAATEAGVLELGGLVTLDMGGTSTDIAFVPRHAEDQAALAMEPPSVAGLPMAIPSLDMNLIGCGGGSLARIDAGGALHVGPESAGADPGPVAYGKSQTPTLTDAFVELGHIRPGNFLGGTLELDHDAVARAFETLSAKLGLGKQRRASAQAMIAIAEAAMARATSAMTLQRGRDPRQLTLVAFGGAGGLMAAGLARALGIPRVLIPRDPGVLSAAGLAHARFASEAARVWLTDLAQVQKGAFRTGWRDLKAEVLAIARLEGQGPKAIELATHANLRYRGQSFELVLPAGDDPRALAPRFHAAHTHFFGYALQDRAVELVSLTVRGTQRTSDSVMPKPRAKACTLPSSGVIQRENLKPGHHFAGPAIVSEYSGTTSIPAGVTARVTSGAHLLLEIG